MARNRVTFRVRGVRELAAALPRYGEDVVRSVARDADGLVRTTVTAIQQDAPFDPAPDDDPHLREQVDGTLTFSVYGFRARIRARARNAHLQEFGTARHAAQPFFIRHIREARGRLEQIIAATIARRAPRDLGQPRVRTRSGTASTPTVGVG